MEVVSDPHEMQVAAVLEYATHNNVEPFLEPVLELCHAIVQVGYLKAVLELCRDIVQVGQAVCSLCGTRRTLFPPLVFCFLARQMMIESGDRSTFH